MLLYDIITCCWEQMLYLYRIYIPYELWCCVVKEAALFATKITSDTESLTYVRNAVNGQGCFIQPRSFSHSDNISSIFFLPYSMISFPLSKSSRAYLFIGISKQMSGGFIAMEVNVLLSTEIWQTRRAIDRKLSDFLLFIIGNFPKIRLHNAFSSLSFSSVLYSSGSSAALALTAMSISPLCRFILLSGKVLCTLPSTRT